LAQVVLDAISFFVVSLTSTTMTRRCIPLVFSATLVSVQADSLHAGSTNFEVTLGTRTAAEEASYRDGNGKGQQLGILQKPSKAMGKEIRHEVFCANNENMCEVGFHCLSLKCRIAPEFNQPNSLRCKATTTIPVDIDSRRLGQAEDPVAPNCIFPFGVAVGPKDVWWFNECTAMRPDPGVDGLPYCAIEVDQDGIGMTFQYCDCLSEEGDTCGGEFVGESGTSCKPWRNMPSWLQLHPDELSYRCQLPSGAFGALGNTNRKWCALKVDGSNEVKDDPVYGEDWEWCLCHCTKDQDCSEQERCNSGKCEEKPCRAQYGQRLHKCIYPFKIPGGEDDWQYSCTRVPPRFLVGGGQPLMIGDHWCATEIDDDGMALDFQFCDCGTCDENLRGPFDAGYRGCQDHTANGKKCQKWSSQYPHQSDCYNYDEEYICGDFQEIDGISLQALGLGDHNYCRNPDMAGTIWCHTMDPDREWDYCTPKTDTFVGDPIITVNGHKTKVDLPHGLKTLMWKDAIVEIFSKADVMTPDGKNQWFSQFSVNVNGEEALQIATNFRHGVPEKTPDGELKTLLIVNKGRSVAKLGKYDLGHNVVVEVTRHGQQEVVSVLSAGFSFSLASAQAKKFLPNVEKANRYTHLDLQIRHMDDKIVKDGILAELYGFIPISLTTAGMISHISSMH